MCIRPGRRIAGVILAETLVALGVTAGLLMVIGAVVLFSGKSFAALANYVDLDDKNRYAIDLLTRDLREANRVKAATATSLTLEDSSGAEVTYLFNSSARTLTRTEGGTGSILLRECEFFTFSLGQRTPVGGSYETFPAATPATCKVVNVAWSCTRPILSLKENSESVSSARIVIRKQT